MDHDGEVGVKKEKDSPCKREFLILPPSFIIKNIHVDGERDVFNQDQAVCHSNTSQDEVYGIGPHVLVGEDQDVDDVEDSPHGADHHGKIAMKRKISILQMNVMLPSCL